MEMSTRFHPIIRIAILMMFASLLVWGQNNVRNPVIEHCTGTWCQFCPPADDILHNQIKAAIPNAISIAYHGPSTSSDPFDQFVGNGIIGAFGFNAYPTAVFDRQGGIQGRGVWLNRISSRANVPATVAIEVTRSYNIASRSFEASIDFTALTALSGAYNYSVLLLEDGLVWSQTGVGGSPNYVHYDVVRDMMNGFLGEEVVNGSWASGQTITKTINRTIPVMPSPSPDIIPDSCHLVVLVYKAGGAFSTNAEIQQAVQLSLIAPDYIASLVSGNTDFLGSSNNTAQNTVVLHNSGLQNDTYTLSLGFDGPAGWAQEFTTINGTFPIGQTDQISLGAGDSTTITVSVSANGQGGFGRTSLQYVSQVSPANNGSIDLRYTTFGMPILVIDDDGTKDYESYLSTALDNGSIDHGVASGSSALAAGSDLNNFDMLLWNTGTTVPGLSNDEIAALKTYLDNGGSLYLNGLDVAYQLADPASGYSTPESQSFFSDYLHAGYVKRSVFFVQMDGVSGDPIGDGFAQMGVTGGTGANTIDFNSGRLANQINPANGATPVFSFFTRPNDISTIKAVHNGTSGSGKVILSTFGFESIAEQADRDLIAGRIANWLTPETGIGESIRPESGINSFALHGNYPNPFNPATTIVYSLPAGQGDAAVSLAVYNQLGQKVRTLLNTAQAPGNYELVWDARDDAGNDVASGIYLYRLQMGDYQAARKMVLLR